MAETKESSSTAANCFVNFPKLPPFSGGDNKGEASFSQWKYELKCLMRDPLYQESTVLQSVRRSLKGTAAGVLLHLGEKASLAGVLEKFEIVFGDVLSTEQILENIFILLSKLLKKVWHYGHVD